MIVDVICFTDVVRRLCSEGVVMTAISPCEGILVIALLILSFYSAGKSKARYLFAQGHDSDAFHWSKVLGR